MAAITKDDLLGCKGLKQGEAAKKLGVPVSSVKYYALRYGLKGFFPIKNPSGPKIAKEVYIENSNVTIPDLAVKLGIKPATIYMHLQHYGLEVLFKVKKQTPTKADGNFYRSVQYTCMTEGCKYTFSKNISNDVSDKRAAGIRWRCCHCNSNAGTETEHSYSGQGD